MGYTEIMRENVAVMWEREKNHPFVQGIGDGTLQIEKFRYYMQQDYIFLVEFCRAISLAVAKAKTVEDMGAFARLLHETLNTEMALHIGFCEDFGITEHELKNTRPSPTTVAYTSHLVQSSYSGNTGDIASAILPCSWGYSEIGKMLLNNGLPINQPLYCRWIEMYASEEFAELAEWLRSVIDKEAEEGGNGMMHRMNELFITGSRFEYMFWDAAYRMENWIT